LTEVRAGLAGTHPLQHSTPQRMTDSTRIIDFWRANPAYWLPATDAEKATADAAIHAAFWTYIPDADTLSGHVIYLDQFSRHFARLGVLEEEEVTARREKACRLVESASAEEICAMDEVELTFCMMPFKHLEHWSFIFHTIHKVWLPRHGTTLTSFPVLQRFYIDTYKKAYTLERMRAGLGRADGRAAPFLSRHPDAPAHDPKSVCEFYPEEYENDDPLWDQLNPLMAILDCNENGLAPLLRALKPYKRAIVSLSGGVDSMVMLRLLKRTGADVTALHIVYGNRPESEDELRVIAEFCRRLEVKLAVYKIPWLRRDCVEREFYEEMTRQLRFWAYRCLAAAAPVEGWGGEAADKIPVLLGHIQDDVVENIWTNIVMNTHLGDLKKMQAEEVQMGVYIARPFLQMEKRAIYAAAKLLAVPYLKNTTPSWSNRGKFREHFHAATVAQFGAGVDARRIAFAEAMQRQSALVQRFVYEPVYKSWIEGTVNITTAVEAELDAAGWTEIFEHLCHRRLDVSRPSAAAVREFCRRLKRGITGGWKMHLSGKLMVRVWLDAGASASAGTWKMKLEATAADS
jgi:tRNA(Ile)-lysidine synthase TilS/MesJ